MAEIENLEILIDVLVSDALGEIDKMVAELENLERVANNVDHMVVEMFAQLSGDGIVREQLRELDNERIRVPVTFSRVSTQVSKVEAAIRGLNAQRIRVPVEFDIKNMDVLKSIGAGAIGGGAGRGGGGGIPAPDMPGFSGPMVVNTNLVILNALRGMGGGLGEKLENAGEAAETVARSMSSTSKAVDQSGGIFNLRMTDMHNALAKLVPLLLVFIGALPALLTGFVAVTAAAIAAAAALAAIGGLGALGFAIAAGGGVGVENLQEGFMEIIREIATDFLDAFRPLAERLAPLFEDALDGLDKLFEEIARRGHVLEDLRDDARAFGEFVFDFLPDMLAGMGEFAEVMGPVLGMLADFVSEMNLLAGLANFTGEALPSLVAFSAILVDLLPTIIAISVGFLDVTTAVFKLLDTIGKFIGLLELIPGVNERTFGIFIASMLAAITVGAVLAAVIKLNLIGGLIGLIGWINASVGAWIMSNIVMGEASLASLALAGAMQVLRAAVIGLLAATGIGLLIATVGTLAGTFMTASGSIDTAADSLKNFKDVQDGMNDMTVPRGSVNRARFFGGGGAGGGGGTKVVANIDNRGLDHEEARANTETSLWRMKKMSD